MLDDHPPMSLKKKKTSQVGQEEDSKPAKRRRGRNNSSSTTTTTAITTTTATTTTTTPTTTPTIVRSTTSSSSISSGINPDNTIMSIEKDFIMDRSIRHADKHHHDVDIPHYLHAKEEGYSRSSGDDGVVDGDMGRAIKSNPLYMIYLINAHPIDETTALSLYSFHQMMIDILSQSLYSNTTETMMTTQYSVNGDNTINNSNYSDKRTSCDGDESFNTASTKYQNSQYIHIIDDNSHDNRHNKDSSSSIMSKNSSSSSSSIVVIEKKKKKKKKKRAALSIDGSTSHQSKKKPPSTTAVAWTCIKCTFYNTKSGYPFFCEICCYDRRVDNRLIATSCMQENDTADTINGNAPVIIDLVSDDEDKHDNNDQNNNNNGDGDDFNDDDGKRFQRFMHSSRDRLMHQLEAIVTHRYTLLNSMNMDTKIVSSLALHLNIPSCSSNDDGRESSRRQCSSNSNSSNNTSLELELLQMKDRSFAQHHASQHHHVLSTAKSTSSQSSPLLLNIPSFISSSQQCIKNESNLNHHIIINHCDDDHYFQFTNIIPEPSIVIMQGRRFGNPQRKGKSQFWGKS